MKRFVLSALAGLFLVAATTAFAEEGFVTTSVYMRAGPDVDYPVVLRLPPGAPVEIVGCVDDWLWCDVIAGPDRGWVAGAYLQEEYGGRRVYIRDYGLRIGIPIISFAFGDYWDHYYRGRSWYGHRDRWSHVRSRYYSGGHYRHGDRYYGHNDGYRQRSHGSHSHGSYSHGSYSHGSYSGRDSGNYRTRADYSAGSGRGSGDYSRHHSRDSSSGYRPDRQQAQYGSAPVYRASHTRHADRGGHDGGRHSSGGRHSESHDRHGDKRGHDDGGSDRGRDHRRH